MSFQKFITMIVVSFLLHGCSSMESLLDTPKFNGSATIDEYDISLFENSIHLFTPVALEQRASDLKLQRRIENLIVLVDPPPQDALYRGVPESVYQREVLRRFNRTMPWVNLNGGIWQLGGSKPASIIGHYRPDLIETALDKGDELPFIGSSSLSKGIDITADMAASMKGRTALVMLTHWGNINKDVEESIARFYQRGETEVGFRLIPTVENWQGSTSPYCVFSIGTGDSMSRSLLEDLDRCGDSQASDRIMQPRDMAHFVENIVFMGPMDSDNDGIYDFNDKCPDTPDGQIIKFDGCEQFDSSQRGDYQ